MKKSLIVSYNYPPVIGGIEIESNLNLEYTLLEDGAKFKVGKYEEDIDLYDMMIDVKENTLSALIKEIHHYLTVINQKNAS